MSGIRILLIDLLKDLVSGITFQEFIVFMIGFVLGHIFRGILGRSVPNIIEEYIKQPRLNIVEIESFTSDGWKHYQIRVENEETRPKSVVQNAASNCNASIILEGENVFPVRGEPEGKIEVENQCKWDVTEGSVNIPPGNKGRFQVLKWHPENENIIFSTSDGYPDTNERILYSEEWETDHDDGWRDDYDVRNLQGADWNKKELRITASGAKPVTAVFETFPWETDDGTLSVKQKSLLGRFR